MRYSYLWIIMLLVVQSCASNQPERSGLERSEMVLSSMETTHGQVQTVVQQLDRVEASLSELIREGQSDIKGSFKNYSDNVNELNNIAGRLLNNSDDLEKKSDSYLENWEDEKNEFQNPRLQELSSERKKELSESHEEIFTASGRAENRLNSFLTDIKEIRDYLDKDLTAAGIRSVTPLARDVLQESDELQEYLDDMEFALEDAIAMMARRGN